MQNIYALVSAIHYFAVCPFLVFKLFFGKNVPFRVAAAVALYISLVALLFKFFGINADCSDSDA